MKMKQFFCILLTLCMVLSMVPVSVHAEEIASGSCGDELEWALTADGLLTISGAGAMKDYKQKANDSTAPWFAYADQITALEIGAGVTHIGDYAFYNCRKLAEVSLPEGLLTLGIGAFLNCKAVERMELPESLTELGPVSMSAMTSLKEIRIPAALTVIGEDALISCTGVQSIQVAEDNPAFTNDDAGVLFTKDMTQLILAPGSYAGTYVIPEGTIQILRNAFADCNSMTRVDIAATVESIGTMAFARCENLRQIHFLGDAPAMENSSAFLNLNVTAYYPADNQSWTEEVMQPYNAESINWVAETGEDAPVSLPVPEILSCYSKVQTSVKVTWTLSEGAEGYELWRTTTPEDADSWIRAKTINGGAADRYTNQGLEIGTTYYYKVRAFVTDADGQRMYSDFSAVDYMPAAVVFDAPYSNSTFRIRLRWNEISGAHGYQIWRMDDNGNWAIAKTIGDRGMELTNNQGGTTAYSNVGLEAGKTYTYKMRAFRITEDGRKIFGAYSDVSSVAVMPEVPVVTVTSPKAERVQISWDAVNGAAGYQVWMSEVGGTYKIAKSLTDGSTSATIYGLTGGQTYTFKVRAYTEVEGKKTFGAYSSELAIIVK